VQLPQRWFRVAWPAPLTLPSITKEKATFLSGIAANTPPNGHQPDACANLGVTCTQFKLEIDLPRNVWEHPGGVQVAIR
jgi:hypothetical protein